MDFILREKDVIVYDIPMKEIIIVCNDVDLMYVERLHRELDELQKKKIPRKRVVGGKKWGFGGNVKIL